MLTLFADAPQKVIFQHRKCRQYLCIMRCHRVTRLASREVGLARKKHVRKVEREKTLFEVARDELLLAVRQCGVLEASEQEQREWLSETVAFLAERYPALAKNELEQLESFGIRFCQPVIPHGTEHSALAWEDANAA